MLPKLGKKPFVPNPRNLRLQKYAVDLPQPKPVFGFGKLKPYGPDNWLMLGNDEYGDCVFAGAAHETMIWNKLRQGVDVPFTDSVVLDDYSAVTGFTPDDPSSDQGTVVADALDYRLKTGVLSASRKRHKIATYLQLETGNFEQMVQATYILGCVGIGFAFPDYAFEQFDNGEPWDVRGGGHIEGGHYVPAVGSMDSANEITVITWGKRQVMTRAFYEKYADEAWAMLSEEQLRDGKGIHGLDLDALKADLAGL